MATILLSAAGMALGGSVGGTVLGLSTAVAGRFVGATLGRVIDQRLMGSGSEVIESGQVDTLRLTGASEGAPLGQVFGRMRIGGQIIWASPFRERVRTQSSGGKGAAQPSVTSKTYSYSVSLAIALCEGPITCIGRIWADGIEISADDLNLRVYTGHDTQQQDPTLVAHLGADCAPAYRGTAYLVVEDLNIGQFGNRVPQFNVEVMNGSGGEEAQTSDSIEAVAMIPGTGEYSLATTPVHVRGGFGRNKTVNINSASGKADFVTSTDQLVSELPNCKSVSLIVSWFGNDLRCGQCSIEPKVEQTQYDASNMAWNVSGQTRATASAVAQDEGRPVYGGTPTDASVVQAIRHMNDIGQDCMFYPFILMEQMAGNGLPDPYSDEPDQPVLPWRGRITTQKAPDQQGTSDGTLAADQEVAAFFGVAAGDDFEISGTSVTYTGPAEWSYRRFILHYAHLCKAAGGVGSFCIGSEMRGLTQIRGASGFPSVDALVALASDVRAILGPDTKISYASDWSEYFGYQPNDGSGDRYFHLDPLWADENIDFIGIDNYMPLSDWRDGPDHLDIDAGSIYNLDYLMAGVAGGEGYDWFYPNQEARDAQIRTPISDDAHNEPWIYRYKDIRSWWDNAHYERIGGQRAQTSTAWQPQSKPIWFTEYGCAAMDKGTNQPNKFLDPKSSESQTPYFSNGQRDDFMQAQYLRAMTEFWSDPQNNPTSQVYNEQMIDMSRAHAWAWDARPFPHFPNNSDLWSDGENYGLGHWLNGRATARSLSSVVREITMKLGLTDVDTSQLFGLVRGYQEADVQSARAALQPLLLTYGITVVEREGKLIFKSNTGTVDAVLDAEKIVFSADQTVPVDATRASEVDMPSRARITFVEADRDYETRSTEAFHPTGDTATVSNSSVPLALSTSQAVATTERWLAEARVARDSYSFVLPPSKTDIGAGDTVQLNWAGGQTECRVDHIDEMGAKTVQAVRVDTHASASGRATLDTALQTPYIAPSPVDVFFMDLPLLKGDENSHAPYIAALADPWPGGVAIYSSPTENGYTLVEEVASPADVGIVRTNLDRSCTGRLLDEATLVVEMVSGALSSTSLEALLAGANVAAIGTSDTENWEIIQFQNAEMTGPDEYRLTGLIRGQAGTDGIMPDVWPAGARFVILSDATPQIGLPLSSRGIARNYLYGPSSKGYSDPSFTQVNLGFSGVGLRPYAPCHLAADLNENGDIGVTWIRRTRFNGDTWDGLDVPLNEEKEHYEVVIAQSGIEKLRESVDAPFWSKAQAEIDALVDTGPFDICVAQVSAEYGAGPIQTVTIDR